MRPTLLSLLAAASLTVLTACADHAPTAPAPAAPAITPSDELAPATSFSFVTSVVEPVDGTWARIITGRHGGGAQYSVYIPRTEDPRKRVDVVFYAHGFRDAWKPVELGDQDTRIDQDDFVDIREELGERGFAVAYSSYSQNGFAVRDGTLRTLELLPIVALHMRGRVGRTYLMGHSLGAGIALHLAETLPRLYDGALLMCGMVGGSRLQTQYLGHVRALFDFYYPGVLPGGVLDFPSSQIQPDANWIAGRVVPRVLQNPAGLLAIASTAEAPLPFVSSTNPQVVVGSLLNSVVGALTFHARGIESVIQMTNGESPFDNTANYTVGTALHPLAAVLINDANDPSDGDAVARVAIGPTAQRLLERHFTPTGKLRIPVITLYNVLDPGVPAFHEAELRRLANAASAGHMLRQYPRGSNAHCGMSVAEVMGRFDELVGWVPAN